MRPTRAISPLQGIRDFVGQDVEVVYSVGAYAVSTSHLPSLVLLLTEIFPAFSLVAQALASHRTALEDSFQRGGQDRLRSELLQRLSPRLAKLYNPSSSS
jgi:hypothetical protein